jgi:hypothetical protein
MIALCKFFIGFVFFIVIFFNFRTPTTKRLLEDQKKTPLIKLSKCGKCSAVGIYIIGFILLILSLGMLVLGMVMQTNPSFNNFILLTLVDSNVTPATAIQRKMNFILTKYANNEYFV